MPAFSDQLSLPLADGYTVEDIVLYWEGNGNAIQGTEKLHIPQFSFLGKTMSSKEVFFYTGGCDLLSHFFCLWYPGKLHVCLPLTSTLSAASSPIAFWLWTPSKIPFK